MSRSAKGIGSPSLSLRRRIAIAAPGAAATALLFSGGVYFAVIGIHDAASLPAGDDFASIPAAIASVGVLACVAALMLAATTRIVSLAKPRPILLTLAAVFAGCCATCTAYVLATGADAIVYVPLTAVLTYLAGVAVLRLLSMHWATNA